MDADRQSHEFQISESQEDGWLRLALTGDLDMASAPTLEARLGTLRVARSPVRLDLSKLRFVDSTGLRLVIQCVGDARIKRWAFEIDPNVAPDVMRLFRLVRLDRFLERQT